MPTTLPHITQKQQQLLKYLYIYRFVTTTQFQQFMGHRDRRRVLSWLQDLRTKGYVDRNYATDFVGRTKPASYYLSSTGIRWFRSLGTYQESELRKRYDEAKRGHAFIETCQLITQTGVQLEAIEAAKGTVRYFWALPTDYHAWGEPFTTLVELQPSLYFVKHTFTETTHSQSPYILELVPRTASQRHVRNRLLACIRHLDSLDWNDYLACSPTMLFDCPDKAMLTYAKRLARRLLEDEIDSIPIHFSTLDQFAAKGLLGPIWEHVKVPGEAKHDNTYGYYRNQSW